jgi:phosphate/sulfate permease
MNSILLWLVVAVALGFDFTNGFHDNANAVATSVSTRALSPRVAVLVAAVANLADRTHQTSPVELWSPADRWACRRAPLMR